MCISIFHFAVSTFILWFLLWLSFLITENSNISFKLPLNKYYIMICTLHAMRVKIKLLGNIFGAVLYQ